MTCSFLSINNGYWLFKNHKIFGQPIEKCITTNFNSIKKNGFWTKGRTHNIGEMHYFKLFQYPIKNFPGLCVIKAYTNGIKIDENRSYFLADFMTVDKTCVVGNVNISETETRILAEEIQGTFDYFRFNVVGPGQILVSFPGRYPFFEWRFPFQLIGSDYTDYLPVNKTFRTLVRIISNSWRILKNHSINRVRIDLGENPANFLWFHSQNRHNNTIQNLGEKINKNILFWSGNSIFSDFARYVGFECVENIPETELDNVFLWADIEIPSEDMVRLIKKWEVIDREIIPQLVNNSDKLMIEFNGGFYNNNQAIYFFYPHPRRVFLSKLLTPGKLPARFLFSND
ncbi:MAG TPA: hypothetical protein PKX05_00255 [bacterium]|nr:hypothetical protein [bacterium]